MPPCRCRQPVARMERQRNAGTAAAHCGSVNDTLIVPRPACRLNRLQPGSRSCCFALHSELIGRSRRDARDGQYLFVPGLLDRDRGATGFTLTDQGRAARGIAGETLRAMAR